jgi:protein-tyrosine-phosphatase
MIGLPPSRDMCSGALGAERNESRASGAARNVQPPLVLFVCRLNTAVSIMAEAILRHFAQGRWRAASGGALVASPAVNPFAMKCLHAHGIATTGLHSKVWGEFFGVGKPPVRLLITLGEVYAARADWPGDTLKVHWDTPDPAELVGSDVDLKLAFERAYRALHARIQRFLSLEFGQLDDPALLQALTRIGEQST